MAITVTVVKANTSAALDTAITAALAALGLADFKISVVFDKGELIAFIYTA